MFRRPTLGGKRFVMFGLGSVFDFLTSLSLISQLFIAGILGTAIWFNVRYSPKVVELGPTILTTLGIFGTFLGVAIGLTHFDTANVQASVPALLAGLKTAFWASVFGVGAAVQIKAREFLFGSGENEEGEANETSPLAVLVDIRDSLASTGDASLLQQLRLIRQDLNDRLLQQIRLARQDSVERMDAFRAGQTDMVGKMDALTSAQSKALHQLAAAGSQTLVDALQQVVVEFNDKVAGQFGENYRELHLGVAQLVQWQGDYRETITTTNNQLADTLRQLGYAASDFKAMTEGNERFAKTAERVGRTLDGIEAGEKRLTDMAVALAKLTEEASGRIPFIESRLYELTMQMTHAVQANQETLNKALAESAADMRKALETSQLGFADIARAGAEQVRENQTVIAGALEQNATVMSTALQETQRNLLAAVNGFDTQTAELLGRTKDRVLQLDNAMAADLTKSIENLTQQLTAHMEAATDRIAVETQKPRPAIRLVDAAAGGD